MVAARPGLHAVRISGDVIGAKRRSVSLAVVALGPIGHNSPAWVGLGAALSQGIPALVLRWDDSEQLPADLVSRDLVHLVARPNTDRVNNALSIVLAPESPVPAESPSSLRDEAIQERRGVARQLRAEVPGLQDEASMIALFERLLPAIASRYALEPSYGGRRPDGVLWADELGPMWNPVVFELKLHLAGDQQLKAAIAQLSEYVELAAAPIGVLVALTVSAVPRVLVHANHWVVVFAFDDLLERLEEHPLGRVLADARLHATVVGG